MATNSNITVPPKYATKYKNVVYGWDTSHPTTISKKFIILIYHYLHTVLEMNGKTWNFYSWTKHRLLVPNCYHSVEVMVYQYDKLLGYGCWMTSIPTMSHHFLFLGYSEFPIWLPWQPIEILQYPKSIQQNIKMWDMVGTLVIQQPYPKSLSY